MISSFKAETNATFFDAETVINYRLYIKQNESAAVLQTLSSIIIQLSSENLDLPDLAKRYSVNISNTIQTVDNILRINNSVVQLNITGSLNTDDYMEIKFNASVSPKSGPLSTIQAAFTLFANASSVSYGPKYSDERYTTYSLITLARTTENGKPLVTKSYLLIFCR